MAPERLEFEAVVEAEGPGAFVQLPDHTAERFGTRARFPVSATFNGVEYRGSTMPTGDGRFCLGLNQGGAGRGRTWRWATRCASPSGGTPRERTVEAPDDLATALATHPEAARRFEQLSYTHRKEYVDWLESAKRADTRARRVQKAVEMIAGGEA